MKRTKRQHILPVSYLRRFSEGEKVWVHNFQKETSYINNIEDAACIDDFYTVHTHDNKEDDLIESNFLAKIEGIGNPIIDQMINKMQIPKGREKSLFCNYIAIMYSRGVWFRQILLEVYEHFAHWSVEQLLSDEVFFNKTMEEIKSNTGIDYDLTFKQAKEISENADIGVNIPRTFYVKEMMIYAAPMVNIFCRMNFNLIYTEPLSDSEFITSDKPIVAVPSDIIGQKYQNWLEDPDVELYFPLSSKTCLMIDKKNEPRFLSAGKNKVASINGVLTNDCVYITISKHKEYIWFRKNKTISHSIEELFALLSEDKRNLPRVNQISGQELKSKARSNLNILKGKDE